METAEMAGAAAAALYYAFTLFGSVSFGYVFLRLTQPEIRTSSKRRKLLLSLAVGIAFILAAFGLEYALYGEQAIARLEAAAGLTPLLALAAAAFCLLVFKIVSSAKSVFTKQRTMEVAIAAPPEKEGAARLLPFVQEVRKFEADEMSAPQCAPQPASEAPIEEPSFEKFEVKPSAATLNAASEAARQAAQTAGKAAAGKSVREKLEELKNKGVISEREKDETPQPAVNARIPAEAVKLETPPMQLTAPPVLASAAAQAPTPTPTKTAVAAGVLGKPRYAKSDAGEAKASIAQATSSAPTRAPPLATPLSFPPQSQAPQPQKKEEKGFLQKIFGSFGSKASEQRAPQRAQAYRGPPKPSEEHEIEVILDELHLIKAPVPVARKPLPRARGAAAAAQADEEEEGPAQRHRLYLERRGGGGGSSARARLESERMEKAELNALFSDVYSQLEKPGKPGAARAVAQRGAPRGPNAPAEKPLSINDLFGADAFAPRAKQAGAAGSASGFGAGGGAGATGASAGGASVFSQLESLDASGKTIGSEQTAPQAVPQVQVVKMRVAANAGCPHCGAKNVRVVFCPYCGSGMCANCTPSLKPTPEAFVYVCPKCGEEVPVARAKKV
ncbi:MAG: hypothetical protein V1817_03285 [Candidatus Micrarchaeota archaeon]